MINFFANTYASVIDKHVLLKKVRYYSILRLTIRVIANIVLPCYFRITSHNQQYQLKKRVEQKEELIISLTSFPLRIKNIWLVLESILRQDQKPDRLILWLSKKQFKTIEELPLSLQRLQKRGVEIKIEDEDLRSHKKYYYALKNYPDAILLTIDDDIIYHSTMIKKLFDYHKTHPKVIVCNYAFKMNYEYGCLQPYSYWNQIENKEEFDRTIFFGTGGGTLFPPHSLHKDAINDAIFMKLCPLADDVWLNSMARLAETPISKIEIVKLFLPVINRKNKTLNSVNVDGNMNDKQIKNTSSFYIQTLGVDPFTQKENSKSFI